MKTTRILTSFAALSLCALAFPLIGTAATTVIEFSPTMDPALGAVFPTNRTSGNTTAPVVKTGFDVSGNYLPGYSLRLLAGDKSATTGARQGQTTLYSTNYSDDLDFVSKEVTISFDGIMTNYSSQGAAYTSRVGISNQNITNGLSGTNSIFLLTDRSNSLFGIYSLQDGKTQTIAQWAAADILGQSSINNIAIKTFTLTLSATEWSYDITFMLKNNQATTESFTNSGSFTTAWTAESWGDNAYIALNSVNTQGDADGSVRFTELAVGTITITSIPEANAAALFTGLGGLAFAGMCCRRHRR